MNGCSVWLPELPQFEQGVFARNRLGKRSSAEARTFAALLIGGLTGRDAVIGLPVPDAAGGTEFQRLQTNAKEPPATYDSNPRTGRFAPVRRNSPPISPLATFRVNQNARKSPVTTLAAMPNQTPQVPQPNAITNTAQKKAIPKP